MLRDLASTAVDLRTVKAHVGHPWNELADSLAKRESRSDQHRQPQPEWTEAFSADREREWEWMHQADDKTLRAYPTLTPDGLRAPTPTAVAQPEHFVPDVHETVKKATVDLKAATFNVRSFREPSTKGANKRERSLESPASGGSSTTWGST